MKISTELKNAVCGFTLALPVFLTAGTNCFAQTQIITLAVAASGPPACYAVTTNQVIQVTSLTGTSLIENGNNPAPFIALFHSSGITISSQSLGTYTGLTNIQVFPGGGGVTSNGVIQTSFPGLATVVVTTPSTSLVVSNYVPADAIVIPANAAGNVQIILESSPDLVNWTAASPGTYGASAGTNRFFRVRAAVSP